MDDDTRKNLSNRNIWSRGLYMLFFVIAYSVAETVMALVSLFQFFHALFRGKANPTAQHLGANLGGIYFTNCSIPNVQQRESTLSIFGLAG